jgi:hypothetical protein
MPTESVMEKNSFQQFATNVFTGCSMFFAAAALAQLPPAKAQGPVSYLSGGIGDGEELEMRAAAKDFGVLLEFSEVERGTSHGRWTADIGVVIKSGSRVVLRATSEGPLMLIKLPPGTYMVEADRGGAVQTRRIEVKGNALVRERLFWIVDSPLLPR